jgi:hypothetical protein
MTAEQNVPDEENARPAPEALKRFSHSARFPLFHELARRTFYKAVRKSRYWSRFEDVEDAWQHAISDAFVQKPHTFQCTPAMLADPMLFELAVLKYLNKVAFNKLNDTLTTTGKGFKNSPSFDAMLADNPDFDRLYHAHALYAPSTESIVEKSNLHKALNECLSKLTVLMRDTFNLKLAGYSDDTIKDLTQARTEAAVRRRVSEAKADLVKCVRMKSGEAV